MIARTSSTFLLIFFLISVTHHFAAHADSAIRLESSFVRMLDGWPIDGKTLFDCAFLIKKMREMVYGKIINQQTKERQGLYIFRGKKYGTAMLAEIEKEYANDARVQSELKALLHQAKDEFSTLTMPFVDKIKSHKTPVVKLMVESCTKRNVPHSFMLNWTDTPPGKESESFDRQMTAFGQFTQFLPELCNFMSDLFYSCPKARRQYEELLKQYRSSGSLD